MASIYDIDPLRLIESVAKELKKKEEITPPEWVKFVKTGSHVERPPVQEDWWYIRAAAVLRTIYKSGPVGVSKLRSRYGGRKNRGVKPHKFRKASGNIIRKILQQLEAAGLAKKAQVGISKGRIITSKGQALLDSCASKIKSSKSADISKSKEPVSTKKIESRDVKSKIGEKRNKVSNEHANSQEGKQSSKNGINKIKWEEEPTGKGEKTN